jgi:Rieske Fe-S protein
MTDRAGLSRRQLLGAGLSALVCPLLGACAATAPTESATSVSAEDAVTQRDGLIEVDTTRVPQWTTPSPVEIAVVFLGARVIVVRRSRTDFLVLSAECPHAGCGVSVVQPPQLLCPCHGSEFDFNGRRLAGPASSDLPILTADFDAATGRLRIRRAPG